jgi:hypothetical protein
VALAARTFARAEKEFRVSRWKSFWRSCWQDRARRTQLLAGFVVLAALGNVRLLRNVRQYYASNRPPDQTALAIERFAPLRERIPVGQVVGYFGDTRWNAGEREAALDRARFALAPRMVVYGLDQELVVADFPNGDPPGVPPYLELIIDQGSGARLYRNTGAR